MFLLRKVIGLGKMKNKKKTNYYRQFQYRVENKITVADNPIMKDYAKKGCYLYIIHDAIDNNRFFFISSKHFEKNVIVNSETFTLEKLSSHKDSIHLYKKISKFGQTYFTIAPEKADVNITLSKLNKGGTGDKVFRKYKVHNKKIAMDSPDWFLSKISSYNCNSHKKKFEKESLVKNEYNEEIWEHYVSTKFILEDRSFQKFNDHTMVLDQGKTGKSSMICFGSEKADNISIAGLYGSSNGKSGKFEGGLVTLTDQAIILDEINELVEDKKSEKILSILNTILENGEYNYIKQFSAKIESSNQFLFLGNISDTFNFALFLEGTVGNTETIGRRVGIITYSNHLQGFKPGNLRQPKPSPYLNAISMFMSKVMNQIIHEHKFLLKLYDHVKYKELATYYKIKLSKLEKTSENEVVRQFIKSHKESIDRVVFRALKMFIFNNLDKFLQGAEIYTSHTIFHILEDTKHYLDQNIRNLNNIVEHVNNSTITSRVEELNKEKYEKLPINYQLILKFIYDNQTLMTQKSIAYSEFSRNTKSVDLSKRLDNIKRRGVTTNLKGLMTEFGCRIELKKDVVQFGMTNRKLFEKKVNGCFDEMEQIEVEDLI